VTACGVDQAEMPRVEIAHRGDQADARASLAQRRHGGAQLGDASDDAHLAAQWFSRDAGARRVAPVGLAWSNRRRSIKNHPVAHPVLLPPRCGTGVIAALQ
jgi:hypothetical protein